MRIKTVNNVLLEEIVKPAANDLRDLSREDFEKEIIDIVKCSTLGVGRDVAMCALESADFGKLFLALKKYNYGK